MFQTNAARFKQQVHSSGSEDDEKALLVSYRSNKAPLPEGPSDQGATSILQTETELDRDAQAIFEKSQKVNEVELLFRRLSFGPQS